MDLKINLISWTSMMTIIIIFVTTTKGYRTDFIQSMPHPSGGSGAVISRQQPLFQQQQGCMWSTLNENNVRNVTTTLYPPFLQPSTVRPSVSQQLECNVRTMNIDFWSNYSFNRQQLESTSRLRIKCNDKLYFDSVLDPRQSFFRLRNLREISLESCKIRRVPTRIFTSLGFLKTLSISSLNGEWSTSVGMDIENGAFEGLSSLEKLDLSQNNIWAIHDKNVFCPLKSLLKLNMSRNRLSDLEELGFSGLGFRASGDDSTSSSASGNTCVMSIQNLDLSHNAIRRLNANAFLKLKKLSELRLQNSLIYELEDNAFNGLTQLRLLNLSSNRLVALSPIFKFSTSLRDINLSNNSISALSPQIFDGLAYLVSLDLSRNLISTVPIRLFAGLGRLIVLKLSHNQLTYIDAAMFKDLVQLQALHLDYNMLESINPKAFENLRNLHSLDLSKNKLTLIDSRHFSNLHLLRQISLDHNRIREMDSDSLKNCSNLQDVGLAGNDLTQVPVALRGLSHLVTLDIGENKIDTITNESFSGLGQLYGLRIVDNKLTEVGWNFCLPLPKLRVLNVAQNLIRQISPAAFTHCPELRALRLDANLLEDLPPTLAPQLPSLLWLNASENRLKWADYKILPKTVEWLDLSHNSIETLGGPGVDAGSSSGREGGKQIPYSLRVLDASFNKLKNIDYTTVPPTLETLRLNHNLLTSISPDTFSRAARLRRVEITGNNIESLPLPTLRFPPVSIGKPVPEFFISGNPFLCNCENEWMSRVNQLAVLRQYPRIVDLNSIVCRPTFPRYQGSRNTTSSSSNQAVISLLDARAKDFICPYKSHCFALCSCCEFEFCDCQNFCPDSCNCYHDNAWSSNIVECSNSQFKQIPSRIPMDATEIYLDGNELPTLDSHIFIGKKNLRVLYLNSSGVETIKNKTFNGLKSLEVLLLNDNKLGRLDGPEFADLENLRELFLHNNVISYISPETFSRLTFLSVLRLDGNLLVDFNVWKLSANTYLSSVMLAKNPWSCDCEYLVPFRTWVAARNIVVDFSAATCQDGLVVGSNSTTAKNFYGNAQDQEEEENEDDDASSSSSSSSNNDKINEHQASTLIINMCDHNKELNFNFNPNNSPDNIPDNVPHLLESELLNSNHISAEKVASTDMNVLMDTINTNNNHNNNNNYNHHLTINDDNIPPSQNASEKESALWTIFTSVLITLLIVLLVILLLVFRKDHNFSGSSIIPFFFYSWCNSDGGDDEEENEEGAPAYGSSHQNNFGLIPSLLSCCCRGNRVGQCKRSRKRNGRLDDSDKLFDAYFLYSRKDEDLLLQKIAPELESPTTTFAGIGNNGLISHIPPPPPPHHGGNGNYHRLCLHYRDLCLSQENPLNTDMVLSACDASKRIVLMISRSFLQNEMSHPGFRSAIQTAINRYHNKLIFLLLPPFTEQNLTTIYPELKAGHFQTMTSTLKGVSSVEGLSNPQIQSLEWSDKNFWSKFKLMLPTPVLTVSASSPSGLNSTSTISSTGSSALFNHNNMMNYNNSMGLHDYAYNTINSQHQYHRNILPYTTNTPPVPKHHIALPGNNAWQQQHHPHHQQQLQNQNFYNNSQHSQIIPIPGYPAATVSAGVPLIMPTAFPQPNNVSFNESFRRHLQLQQSQNRGGMMGIGGPPVTSPAHQHQHHHSDCGSHSHPPHPHHNHPHHHHHHQHQGSHSSSHSSSTSNNNPSLTPYQPLDANYSSSSSNEELLDHVYSTLDSPPIITNNNGGSSELAVSSKKINMESGSGSGGSGQTKNGNDENSSSQQHQTQNRLNTNSAAVSSSSSNNNSSSSTSSNNNNSQQSNPNNNSNNGTMYFV